ncbi:MAG: hypothetical protein ABUL69_02885, partial [Peristeroidobacter soli]
MKIQKLASLLMCSMLAGLAGQASAQVVSQQPLSAGGNVPGNLVLTPSVEWPTLDSVANIDANYAPATVYVGYFDSEKCYNYNYDSSIEANRYFYPVGLAAAGHVCSVTLKQWSGNFLNWATMQTIDPFRKGLTGGYRTTDTTTVTILEKARADTQAGTGIFPDRNLTDSTMTSNATPATSEWGKINTRVRGLGNKMRFSRDGDLATAATDYNPTAHTLKNTAPDNNRGTVFEVSVRVKVCDPSATAGGVESNCTSYGSNWKPEGLIQKYSSRMRFSVFGYLNDSGTSRNGSPMRDRMKFVGPMKLDPTSGWIVNPNREWDSSTGVMVINP